MDRREITTYLRSASDELEALCTDLTDEQFAARPDAGQWSVIELICHLRDSVEEEGRRIRRLIEEDNPTLVPYDQDTWAIERNYRADNPKRALTTLRAFFGGLAYQIESLSDGDWQRTGCHAERGVVTVATCAESEADHAREHLAQVRDVASRIQ